MQCKNCKAELEALDFSAKVEQSGTYDGDNWDTDNYGDWSELIFSCPDCGEQLAETQEKANKLLKKTFKPLLI